MTNTGKRLRGLGRLFKVQKVHARALLAKPPTAACHVALLVLLLDSGGLGVPRVPLDTASSTTSRTCTTVCETLI